MTGCEAESVLQTVYSLGMFGIPHIWLLMKIRTDFHVQI